jgi:ferredoxin
MLTLYFSGTGNSKYIAQYFSKLMGCQDYSIEESVDFINLIDTNDTIAFCYPIYGSCVPMIMREFVTKYKSYLNEKKLIIFCTQLLFSGDGARVFTDLLKGASYKVIYAEHFNMPNNICNFFLLPIANDEKTKKYIINAECKMNRVCENINKGIIRKRGFNIISKYTGLFSQRFYFRSFEKKAKSDVRISDDCILCDKCIRICPMKNLKHLDKRIEQNGNCTLCYRCVNMCPQKAITVFIHSKVKQQYEG